MNSENQYFAYDYKEKLKKDNSTYTMCLLMDNRKNFFKFHNEKSFVVKNVAFGKIRLSSTNPKSDIECVNKFRNNENISHHKIIISVL